MTPGQAKAEAMADQAAGRSGRRPPSMGKGAPQIGDKSLARRDAMRRRAELGKEEEWLKETQAWAREEVCVCKEDLEWVREEE